MTIVVDPDDRRAMKAMIVEMTYCLQKIEDQREAMKDIATAAEEKFSIKKKFVNKMARTMFKHSYADLQSENESFELLYETVIEGAANQ